LINYNQGREFYSRGATFFRRTARPHCRYIGRTRTGCYPCLLRSGIQFLDVTAYTDRRFSLPPANLLFSIVG